MSKQFSTIALSGKHQDSRVLNTMHALAQHLLGKQLTVLTQEADISEQLPAEVKIMPSAELASEADLIIAIGGDGSMLHAARIAIAANKPLLGVNRGRLGFLADVNPGANFDPLDQILAGDYVSETRMLLKAEILSSSGTHDCGFALNDVVIKREDTGRLLEFKSHIDERYVNTHSGDGFIIATPTGSTAYALSCGGPIVAPGMDALVLAPICPHTLSDRPIVIPGVSITDITLGDDDTDKAAVSCDGEVAGQIESGDRLRVAVADQRVELIHPSSYDYYDILRSKLHWGRGNRTTSQDR